MKIDIYVDQPKQAQLLDLYEESEKRIIGFGGARGGSKSYAGRSIMLLRRFKYKDTGGWIVRRTLDDLRDNHIRPLLNEHPELREHFNKQEKILSLPNNSWIRFISSDNYDDIFSFIGKEAADILVDQAEQFSQEQLEFLTTCNRCTTNDEIIPKTMWCFNPGSIGHSFLKRIFIQKDFIGNEDPDAFGFIRAYGWDNAKWVSRALKRDNLTEKDYYGWSDEKRFAYFIKESDYGRTLNTLPDSQRKAQLFGDFDVFEGQFFDMWRHDLHVVDPIMPPDDWNIVGVIDYGERTALEVQCRDFEGNIINFAESYSESRIPLERFAMMAEMLIERKLWNLRILYDTNMDISLVNYVPGFDKTPAQVAREVFAQVFERANLADKAPSLSVVSKGKTDGKNYRIVCNEAMIQAMSWQKNDDGTFARRPKFYVTRECTQLIKTMPELIRDKHSLDGLDFDKKVGQDDCYDAAKMALLDLWTPTKPPEPTSYESESDYMRKTIFEPAIEESLRAKKGKF